MLHIMHRRTYDNNLSLSLMNLKLHYLKVFSSVFSNIGATLILTILAVKDFRILIFNFILVIISLSLALKLEELICKYDLPR